jgi:hypothetical protein
MYNHPYILNKQATRFKAEIDPIIGEMPSIAGTLGGGYLGSKLSEKAFAEDSPMQLIVPAASGWAGNLAGRAITDAHTPELTAAQDAQTSKLTSLSRITPQHYAPTIGAGIGTTVGALGGHALGLDEKTTAIGGGILGAIGGSLWKKKWLADAGRLL